MGLGCCESTLCSKECDEPEVARRSGEELAGREYQELVAYCALSRIRQEWRGISSDV